MWELDHKESWALKNWCFWTVVLEKTLESPLNSKEIQPVHPKGDQSWIFIKRTDVEADTPIVWPPDVKNWLTWKDPDGGKDWRQEEKGMKDGWMASPTQWTYIWVNCGSWWWTGRPGVLQPLASQRVGHNWTTELNRTNWKSSGEVKRKHHEIDHIPESFLLTSPWRCNACTTRKNPESEWSAKDNTETNPITIKPKTVSHMVEQFFWVPLPYYSPPGCPSQ